MVAPAYWTADMVRALPEDGNRYEVVHGELLVTPAPRLPHQLVVTRLATALSNYLVRQPVGTVLVSPADISWGREDVLVQPDVFVIPRTGRFDVPWSEVVMLLLAIEVLSPSSVRADRFTKRRAYQEFGVLYWMLDAAAGQAEIWTPDAAFPRVETERLVWHPAGAAQPFELPLADLFGPA